MYANKSEFSCIIGRKECRNIATIYMFPHPPFVLRNWNVCSIDVILPIRNVDKRHFCVTKSDLSIAFLLHLASPSQIQITMHASALFRKVRLYATLATHTFAPLNWYGLVLFFLLSETVVNSCR